MTVVGIIANPSSGKDIRRIVAEGWVVSNQEKIAITRRILRGLEAAGVREVLYMPEPRGICPEAFTTLIDAQIKGSPVDIPVLAKQEDSTRAAQRMVEKGASCIITLGGDGTNRAVFKGCGGAVPILPVSTGTNNVFPDFHDGTTAGYAAGLVATGQISREEACWRSKVILVRKEGKVIDTALVDLALTVDAYIGARAVWEVSHLRELFLTRAQPWSIGLSSIGGAVQYLPAEGPHGMHLKIGEGGRKARVPIAPGLYTDIQIISSRLIEAGDHTHLTFERPVALAFDGERDLIGNPGDELTVELSVEGPWVLDTHRTLSSPNRLLN